MSNLVWRDAVNWSGWAFSRVLSTKNCSQALVRFCGGFVVEQKSCGGLEICIHGYRSYISGAYILHTSILRKIFGCHMWYVFAVIAPATLGQVKNELRNSPKSCTGNRRVSFLQGMRQISFTSCHECLKQ